MAKDPSETSSNPSKEKNEALSKPEAKAPKSNRYLDVETEFRGQYKSHVFKTLYYAYRQVIGRIIFLVILGFAGRLLLLSNANLIGIWVDTFCKPGGKTECHPTPWFVQGFDNQDFIFLLLGVTLVGFMLLALFRTLFSALSARAVSSLYDETTWRTSRLPIQFFDTNPVGRVVTRFSSDYGNVFRMFGGPMAEFFAIIFDLICMLILVSLASFYYLPIILFIGLANTLIYRLNREKLRIERRDLSAIRSPSIAHFAETTQGASSIRVLGRQGTFLERFGRLNTAYLTQRLHTSKVFLRFSMQMGSVTALLLLFTGLIGYWLTQEGLVTVGSIGVAFTFIVFSGNSLQNFFEWMGQFEEAMTGVERLDNYLRRDLEPGAKLPSVRSFPTNHPVYAPGEEEMLLKTPLVSERSASVTVEDLWLKYSEDGPYILKGLDFNIRPGEKVGIVGRTGSGKSSFVQALFNLYPFERGRVLIDGQGPKLGVDLAQYRRSIALISQEPTLFRGTLRENLDLLQLKDDATVIDSLKRVGLGEWFDLQPLGLEAPIEEKGRNLSAGERQLLCMARCLLQDAPVVVLDEATSSVDPKSEEILVRATREFFADRTQIIIAHRLTTLIHCDRILWLQQGEVKMFDKPEKVLPIFEQTQLA